MENGYNVMYHHLALLLLISLYMGFFFPGRYIHTCKQIPKLYRLLSLFPNKAYIYIIYLFTNQSSDKCVL